MKKTLIIFFILCLFLVMSMGCQQQTAFKGPKAIQGQLDLTQVNWQTTSLLSLNGEWDFYWQASPSPEKISQSEKDGSFQVPLYWTKYPPKYPSKGCGAYRLVIHTLPLTEHFSLKLPEIYTEYALYVNGQLIDHNGFFPGEDPSYLNPKAVSIPMGVTETELLLLIRNERHVNAGIGQEILLGPTHNINRAENSGEIIDLVISTVCLFAGLVYFILYLYRPFNRELVGFVLLCFAVGLRNIFSNETIIMDIFPDLPHLIGSRVITLTVVFILFGIMLYSHYLYKTLSPQKWFRAIMGINGLYGLMVLFTSSYVYSYAFTYYLLLVVVVCGYGGYVSSKGIKTKQEDIGFYLTGILILIIGGVMDALIYLQIFPDTYMLSRWMVLFILLQIILLARRYSLAFQRVERLSEDLQETLDRVTNTETAYMSAQMKPHFLYNALNTIAEHCDTDPQKAGDLILSLSKYLREILDYDNLKSIVSLKRELELVEAYIAIELARFDNIRMEYQIPEEIPPLKLPPLTLQPLIENAVKHGLRSRKTGGTINLSIQRENGYYRFMICDDGAGMNSERVKELTFLPKESGGIGLYNINQRLLRTYDEGLDIHSRPGGGTQITFRIPYLEEASEREEE
jgi:sensor histidine kinase YesM